MSFREFLNEGKEYITSVVTSEINKELLNLGFKVERPHSGTRMLMGDVIGRGSSYWVHPSKPHLHLTIDDLPTRSVIRIYDANKEKFIMDGKVAISSDKYFANYLKKINAALNKIL